MRFAVMFLLTAVLSCTGYWFFAAQMIERQSAAMLARNPMVQGVAGSVSGFPLAFRSTLQDLEWRSRDGLRGWQADSLLLNAASYQPNRIHMRFPARQEIGLAGLTSELQTRMMEGEVTLGADLTLRAARVTLEDADVEPALLVDRLRGADVALEHVEGSVYTLTAMANALELAPALLSQIDPDDTLPDRLERFQLATNLSFDAPLNAQGQMPGLTSLVLSDAQLDWGPLQMQAEGQLTRNAQGALDGQIALRLQDWRPFHALLVANGTLPPDAAMMAGLFLASQAEAGSNAVTLPLEMRASVLSLGPFALLRLPPF